jgi:hypothetical protein
MPGGAVVTAGHRLAFVVFAAAAVAGCASAPKMPAAGSYSDIILVAAPQVPAAAVASLRAALEAPLSYVGEAEPHFRVTLLPESRLGRERFHKNLILVAFHDGRGPAAGLVRRLLTDDDEARLRRDGAAGFAFDAPFARWQRVVAFAAATPAQVETLLREAGPRLAHEMETSAMARQQDELLVGPDDEARAARLRAAFGFEVRAPRDYTESGSPGEWRDAVQLARPGPTRLLTVFWIDGVEAAQAGRSEFVLGLQRDALWRLHGDLLLASTARVEAGRLGAHAGLVLHGTWQNPAEVAGGPLETYFVHDAARRRLYGIQLQVFAPGKPKHAAMRELRTLAATFRCVAARPAAAGAAPARRAA